MSNEITDSEDSRGAAEPAIHKRELAIDLLAFLVTLTSAILLKWQTKDIVWGLWACSLWLGFVYILIGIFQSVYPPGGKEPRGSPGAGLSILVFFTFHFGMFHYVHSVFLNKIFPLIEVDGGIPSLFRTAAVTMRAYWLLILATIVSRYPEFPFDGIPLNRKAAVSSRPYKNVIRMHILIFVFAGLKALGMSGLAIYPVLLFYFVPWNRLLRQFRDRTAERGQD